MIKKTAEAMPGMMAAVITHLPNLKGYHEHRLEVVQTCLKSLRVNAGMDLPVMVWDNGSCPELITWLVDEFRPEWLVAGPNVGKASARASIVRMVPPETVLAFCDDDMLHYPGWLTPQLKVLKLFPNVGAVSGMPVRSSRREAISETIKWARACATVTEGKFIPNREIIEFGASIGVMNGTNILNGLASVNDVLITYRDMQVYANAQHCQFLCIAARMIPICSWDMRAMINEKPFDDAINSAGMLRLTTKERYTRHMGNVIEADLYQEIERIL